MARTWHRYSDFDTLHSALLNASRLVQLSHPLPHLPRKHYGRSISNSHAVVGERQNLLAVYLRRLVNIAARKYNDDALARLIVQPLDQFLGLSELESDPAVWYPPALAGAWAQARTSHASARCIQSSWRVYLANRLKRTHWLANKRASAELYTERLQFAATRTPLLEARVECWIGLGEWELAHSDCNELLEADPAHSRARELR
jgi:hypothetical protein